MPRDLEGADARRADRRWGVRPEEAPARGCAGRLDLRGSGSSQLPRGGRDARRSQAPDRFNRRHACSVIVLSGGMWTADKSRAAVKRWTPLQSSTLARAEVAAVRMALHLRSRRVSGGLPDHLDRGALQHTSRSVASDAADARRPQSPSGGGLQGKAVRARRLPRDRGDLLVWEHQRPVPVQSGARPVDAAALVTDAARCGGRRRDRPPDVRGRRRERGPAR